MEYISDVLLKACYKNKITGECFDNKAINYPENFMKSIYTP